MPACRYEFYLALVRYRVEHEKIKFVSTCGHVISAIYNYYNLAKTRVNWRDLGSRSRKKARGKGEMLVENFPNLGNKPLKLKLFKIHLIDQNDQKQVIPM